MNRKRINHFFSLALAVFFLLSAKQIIAGPGSEWKLVLSQRMDDSVRVHHILISYIGAPNVQTGTTLTKEQAMRLADSIAELVRSKKLEWNYLCRSYTQDAGSTSPQNGEINYGDYGWLNTKTGIGVNFVKPYMNFAMSSAVGDVGVVLTDFGFHVMEKTESSKTFTSTKISVADKGNCRIKSDDEFQLSLLTGKAVQTKARTIDVYCNNEKVFSAAVKSNETSTSIPCAKITDWMKTHHVKSANVTLSFSSAAVRTDIISFTAKR